MARPKEQIRNYKFSDGELIQLSDKLISCANRDITEMQDFGITTEKLTQLQTQRDDFANLPTDEEMSGAMTSATETKNNKAKQLRKQIRKVMIRVQNKFGIDSGEYKRFGAKDLGHMSDTDLYKCGKRVARVGSQLLDQLATEGLTQDLLDDIQTVTQELDDAIDAQEDAVLNRDIEVDRRVKLGNTIFEVLQKISNTGKAIWEDENEAKYNDYIIYKTGSPGEP